MMMMMKGKVLEITTGRVTSFSGGGVEERSEFTNRSVFLSMRMFCDA